MTKLYAFDAAYAPDLAAVKAEGGIAVNGYLTGDYADTTTQPAAAHAAGLGYVPTYEEGRDELVNASRAAGQAVGRKILDAFDRKGIPLNGTVAVYPSVDVPVGAGTADACNAGWRGIRDVIAGKVSVRAYAEGAVIDALVRAGLVDGPCWLAAPTSWPGFDVNDANVCMIQLVGSPVGGTDQNHLVTDPSALGAWWPAGSPYGGDDMALTDDDVQKIADAVWAHHYKVDGRVERRADYMLGYAWDGAEKAHGQLERLAPEVAGIKALLADAKSGVLTRIASLQAAVGKIPTAPVDVAALAADVAAKVKTVDAGAIADAVSARIKSLTYKAV